PRAGIRGLLPERGGAAHPGRAAHGGGDAGSGAGLTAVAVFHGIRLVLSLPLTGNAPDGGSRKESWTKLNSISSRTSTRRCIAATSRHRGKVPNSSPNTRSRTWRAGPGVS